MNVARQCHQPISQGRTLGDNLIHVSHQAGNHAITISDKHGNQQDGSCQKAFRFVGICAQASFAQEYWTLNGTLVPIASFVVDISVSK